MSMLIHFPVEKIRRQPVSLHNFYVIGFSQLFPGNWNKIDIFVLICLTKQELCLIIILFHYVHLKLKY